jgi:DNA-binding transcriptional regulator YdaS (Cro superfamily)
MDLKTYIANSPRGSAARLAQAVGVSPSYLSQMSTGRTNISAVRARAIEQATGGAVTRREMRPADWHLIWPELVEGDDRAASDASRPVEIGEGA